MISPGDFLRIAVTGSGPQSTIFQNVHHVVHNGSGDVTEANFMTSLGLAITDADDEIDEARSTEYSLDEYSVWRRDAANHEWDGIATDSLVGLVGENAAEPVAHGVAAVGRYITLALRRQGRHFIPGITTNFLVDGLWTGGMLATLADYMAEWANTLTVTGESFVLCTYNTDPESPYYETASLWASTVVVSSIPGYQRRRKPLVGI